MDPEPTNRTAKKLMIVDDDAEMRTLLAEYFRRLGFDVTEKESGPAALQASATDRFDCFILDVAMPEMSGIDLLKKMRERGIKTPALFLTAHDMLDDKVAGFEAGADDYLAKPFSPKELVLRVGAILRRLAAPPVSAGGRLVGGPIVLDRTAHRVTVAGEETELTATEFKLLERLIERRDRVQSRSQLLESVWQAQPDIQTRTVDMHVQRLRAKLGAAGDCIETVRAVGYRFREPAPPPAARRRCT